MTDYELIEEYLNGNLTPEKKNEVNLRIKTDAAFAEIFQLYRMVEEDMHVSEDEKALRATLINTKESASIQAPVIKMSTWKKRKWWLAAGVAAIVAGVFLILPAKPMTDQELLAAYAIPESLPGSTRGTDDSLRNAAAVLYNNKNYEAALPLLTSLRARNYQDASLMMATGVCYMNTGNPDQAQVLFDSLASGSSILKNQALLWKGFTFLKTGQKDSCISVLSRVPVNTNDYDIAKKMINQLNKR